MGRPPEVFVRPVTMTEGQRLQQVGRTSKDPVRLGRAIVVLTSRAQPKRGLAPESAIRAWTGYMTNVA